MKNLTNIEKVANTYGNDLRTVEKKLNSLRSKKSRLAKEKGRKDYDKLMRNLLDEIQVLVEVKGLLDPKEKFVTDYEQADIDRLDFDETVKAIKSIQSKKTHTRWITDVEGDNDEYRKACKIEEMLLKHKESVKPVDEAYIRKTDLVTVIDAIKTAGDVSTARVLEMLEELL